MYKVKKTHTYVRNVLFCIQMLKGHNPDEEIIHKIKNNFKINLIKRLISQWWNIFHIFLNNCDLLGFNLQIEISAALWPW